MPRPFTILLFLIFLSTKGNTQYYDDSATQKLTTQYTAAINYIDAAINNIAAVDFYDIKINGEKFLQNKY